MKLQILINRYTENEEILGRMLKSIEKQDYPKDQYEVLIGNDGGKEILSEDFFRQFSFSLRYFSFPHRGVLATRNALMDLSEAEYIMFIDADDEFHKNFGFSKLMEAAEKNYADIVESRFLSEHKYLNGQIIPNVTINYNHIFLQGKIFRRSFLIQNEIRFFDEMSTSGDMGMVWICFHLAKQTVRIPDVFYTWKYYEKSVTRELPNMFFRLYDKTVGCYILVIENMKKRERQDLVNNATVSLLMMMYGDYYSNEWQYGSKEQKKDAINVIKNALLKILPSYEKIGEEQRKKSYDNYIKSHKRRSSDMPFENIIPWAKKIIESNE